MDIASWSVSNIGCSGRATVDEERQDRLLLLLRLRSRAVTLPERTLLLLTLRRLRLWLRLRLRGRSVTARCVEARSDCNGRMFSSRGTALERSTWSVGSAEGVVAVAVVAAAAAGPSASSSSYWRNSFSIAAASLAARFRSARSLRAWRAWLSARAARGRGALRCEGCSICRLGGAAYSNPRNECTGRNPWPTLALGEEGAKARLYCRTSALPIWRGDPNSCTGQRESGRVNTCFAISGEPKKDRGMEAERAEEEGDFVGVFAAEAVRVASVIRGRDRL